MQAVHMIPVSTPTLLPAVTTNVYIVESNGEALLIDTGYDDEQAAAEIVNKLKHLGITKLVGIVLTHFHRDHALGTKHIVRHFDCPVMCHPAEQEQVEKAIHPLLVSRLIEDEDRIQVGTTEVIVLHTPGHTQGHLSLWWEDEKLLFSGDNIVGEGTTWIGPPDGNLVDYLQSLQRLQLFPSQRIAPGHGPWVTNPSEKIQFVIDRRLEREQQIIAILQSVPCTPSDLVDRIYKDTIPPSSYWAAERTIIGHLEKLVQENKVYQSGPADRPLFS